MLRAFVTLYVSTPQAIKLQVCTVTSCIVADSFGRSVLVYSVQQNIFTTACTTCAAERRADREPGKSVFISAEANMPMDMLGFGFDLESREVLGVCFYCIVFRGRTANAHDVGPSSVRGVDPVLDGACCTFESRVGVATAYECLLDVAVLLVDHVSGAALTKTSRAVV